MLKLKIVLIEFYFNSPFTSGIKHSKFLIIFKIYFN